MKYVLFSLLLVYACEEKKSDHPPDIVTGLIAYFPMDGLYEEQFTNTIGMAHKVFPCPDRNAVEDSALCFNRQDSSSILFGDLVSLSFPDNRFTFSFWIYPDDTLSIQSVFSKRGIIGPWEYSIDSKFEKGFLTCDNWVSDGGGTVYGTDPLSAGARLSPGKWQHIAFVADGEQLICYKNGVKSSGSDLKKEGTFFSNTDAGLTIGQGGNYGKEYFFTGRIDEIKMYNRALDEEAIRLVSIQ